MRHFWHGFGAWLGFWGKALFLAFWALWLALITVMFVVGEPRSALSQWTDTSDSQFQAALNTYVRLPQTIAQRDQLVSFGAKLFKSAELDPNGLACSSCHGLTVTGASPEFGQVPLLDLANRRWFFKDGRAHTLETAVAYMIEHPRFMGIPRIRLVKAIHKHHRGEYERLFPKWQASLRPDSLPDIAKAPLPIYAMPENIARFTLETINDKAILNSILDQSSVTDVAPATLLAGRFISQQVPRPAIFELAAYESLPSDVRQATDQVFFNASSAIAAYLESLRTGESPFDRFVARAMVSGDMSASLSEEFTERELLGFKLFAGPGQCISCHAGPEFTDEWFHNVGLPSQGEELPLGRALGFIVQSSVPFQCRPTKMASLVTETCPGPRIDGAVTRIVGAYRTPSLRHLAHKVGYFHDSRAASLDDVLTHYDNLRGQPAVGRRDAALKPLKLLPAEKESLLLFLKSLSGPIVRIDKSIPGTSEGSKSNRAESNKAESNDARWNNAEPKEKGG